MKIKSPILKYSGGSVLYCFKHFAAQLRHRTRSWRLKTERAFICDSGLRRAFGMTVSMSSMADYHGQKMRLVLSDKVLKNFIYPQTRIRLWIGSEGRADLRWDENAASTGDITGYPIVGWASFLRRKGMKLTREPQVFYLGIETVK